MRMRDEPNPRGSRTRGTPSPPQDTGPETSPYLDALAGYADRKPGRYHVPGHKGGPGADPRLMEAIGERALRMDVPALTYGIDSGPAPTPFQRAQELAAEAWGARRTWFLINGATQGNHAACLALAQRGERVIVQRNVHSSTIDGLILSGLRPRFVADVATLSRIAHDHELPLVVDEAWGAHLRFHESLPQDALSAGADLVISSTHKVLGSLTQSAMLHLGGDRGGLDEHVIDRAVTVVESTSPSALLSGSLDATRRWAALHGRELLDETLTALAELRAAVNELSGLAVLDERLQGRPGVYAWDPVRLAIDVRGTGTTGFELARMVRELDDINLELAGESVLVAVFGMGEKATAQGRRLVAALARSLERLGPADEERARPFAPPPPWGPLELTPREAFLGAQEAVPVEAAAGRIAAESLAAYPPGIANVLPGERLTAETLHYIQETLRHGGALRGAADRTLRTARVAVEARSADAGRGAGGGGAAW
jgi:arginine decarboxylase